MQPKKGFHSDQWFILLTLMIASFLGRLDGTIVNLALPRIISDFGLTISQASWISTAYIISNAIFVPIFGKLGDMIGRKPLYLFGIIGFTVSSMLAGLSFNLGSLIFFRIIQAITVSIDYPVALSIIAHTFQDKSERAQAMGLWSAIFAVAAVFGPLLGGPLIDNFSWRAVFYINLPIGIIGTLMAIKYIQEPVKKTRTVANFDVAGSLLLGAALASLVLVLDQGPTWGWASFNSLINYFIITSSFFLFIYVEKRAKEPVVDLRFFKIPSFTAAIVTSFISFVGLIGGIFLIPLFVQSYLGYSVTRTGYLFIPMAFGMMLAAQLGAKLSNKIEPRFLTAFGMFCAAVMMYFFTGIDIKWTGLDVAWRLALLAFGLGMGLSPLTNAATSTVPAHEVGIASSILALARNISGAFGIAIFATILSNSVASHLLDIQKYSVITNHDPVLLKNIFALALVKANILAFASVFKTTIFVLILGGIAAFFVKENKKNFSKEQNFDQEIAI